MEYCYDIKWKTEEREKNATKNKEKNEMQFKAFQYMHEKKVQISEHVKKGRLKIKLSMIAVFSIRKHDGYLPIDTWERNDDVQKRAKQYLEVKKDGEEKEEDLEIKLEKAIERNEKADGQENSKLVSLLDGVIELPFAKSDMEYIEETELKKYFNKMKLRLAKENDVLEEQIHFFSSDWQLKKMCGETLDCRWLLKLLLFCDILKRVQVETHVDISKVKVGLLDGGNGITEYLMKLLVDSCNFLTVFTERGVYFEEMRDYIYAEEGLMVDLEGIEREQLEQMDVLIDICQEGYKWYKYLKKDAVIFALSANSRNMEGITAKNGKRKTIYDVEVNISNIIHGEDVNIIMEALCWKDWKAAYMVEHFMKDIKVQEVDELCREYGIVLKNIKSI